MSTTTETHYDLLCVAPDATVEELKVAYRRLIRMYHPDIAGPHGEAMSKRINSAWSDLSDPAKRSSYDFSIRKPVHEAPAPQPTRQQETPDQPSERADEQRPQWTEQESEPADEPTADNDPATFYYFPAKHRTWRITWSVLFTMFVAAALVMTAEWVEPSVDLSMWRTIPGLAVPFALFVLFSRRTDRYKTGFFLWFTALIGPLGLLGWWPFAGISEGIAPATLIAMAALTPLMYLTRWAWRNMRRYSAAKKFLLANGEL